MAPLNIEDGDVQIRKQNTENLKDIKLEIQKEHTTSCCRHTAPSQLSWRHLTLRMGNTKCKFKNTHLQKNKEKNMRDKKIKIQKEHIPS